MKLSSHARLSLGTGCGAAVVVAVAVGSLSAGRAGGGLSAWPTLTVAAVATFAMVWCAQQVLMGRVACEVRRIVHRVRACAAQESPAAAPARPGLGLAEMADAVEQVVHDARLRLREALARRRELEVQVRVCDADRQRAQVVLDNIAAPILVTDAFDELVRANETAGRIFRFDPARSVGRPIEQLLDDPELLNLIKDTREAAVGSAPRRRQVEHRMLHGDATIIYQVTLTGLPGDGSDAGAPAGVVTVMRDVTAERARSAMRTDFVCNVSHELRTPLSGIRAYVELLLDGDVTDEATRAEFYGIIQAETNRLTRLVDNILNISRIESGVVRVQRESIALHGLIREAMDAMRPQARARQIELCCTLSPVLAQVFVDRELMHQALLNLIGNAIKYTMSGGRVTVDYGVESGDRRIHVRVSDTGVGIPEEDLPHVFDKFYRVRDHKNLAGGTGLGLNLVKRIVEMVHDGEVRVESRVGEGSTFELVLPCADVQRSARYVA